VAVLCGLGEPPGSGDPTLAANPYCGLQIEVYSHAKARSEPANWCGGSRQVVFAVAILGPSKLAPQLADLNHAGTSLLLPDVGFSSCRGITAGLKGCANEFPMNVEP
jgi:hypothetical protein